MTEFKKEVASTERFSDRVADYVKYRPNYPEDLFTYLKFMTRLSESACVADIGSGTGISTGPLLDLAKSVYAVEPNAAMRAAANQTFGGRDGFQSLEGTAEKTGIPDRVIDLIVAAQAFHWFDPSLTAQEWRRILKPNGWVALIWNERAETGSVFLEGYEALLKQLGTDYGAVKHQNLKSEGAIEAFFGKKSCEENTFHNTQSFDFDGIKGRLLSSSYAPNIGHPKHKTMLQALKVLFDHCQQEGQVEVIYQTKLYLGKL